MSERRKTFRAKGNPPANRWDTEYREQAEERHKAYLRGELQYPIRKVKYRKTGTAVQRFELDDE